LTYNFESSFCNPENLVEEDGIEGGVRSDREQHRDDVALKILQGVSLRKSGAVL
jgi:hypothetical protein